MFNKTGNGNIWLVIITGDVQVNYRESSGMSIPQVTFNWTQIGDANNQNDLYTNGVITEVD